MPDLGKLLIAIGGILVLAGVVFILLGKAHIPLGHLPGDITWRSKNTVFYFPIVTSIVISVVLSLILWLINSTRR